jgi:hypothetical protein
LTGLGVVSLAVVAGLGASAGLADVVGSAAAALFAAGLRRRPAEVDFRFVVFGVFVLVVVAISIASFLVLPTGRARIVSVLRTT